MQVRRDAASRCAACPASPPAQAARRPRPAAARRNPNAPPSGPGTRAPTADNPPSAARGPQQRRALGHPPAHARGTAAARLDALAVAQLRDGALRCARSSRSATAPATPSDRARRPAGASDSGEKDARYPCCPQLWCRPGCLVDSDCGLADPVQRRRRVRRSLRERALQRRVRHLPGAGCLRADGGPSSARRVDACLAATNPAGASCGVGGRWS